MNTWQPINTLPENTLIDIWVKSTHNPMYGVRMTDVHVSNNKWYGLRIPNPEFGEYVSHWLIVDRPN